MGRSGSVGDSGNEFAASGKNQAEIGLEYGDDEAINIPVVATVHSNFDQMKRKEDLELSKLNTPRIY